MTYNRTPTYCECKILSYNKKFLHRIKNYIPVKRTDCDVYCHVHVKRYKYKKGYVVNYLRLLTACDVV